MPKVLPGHEDLKSRNVIGIDGSGRLLVDYGEQGVRRFTLRLAANGALSASPYTEPNHDGPDQIGPPPESPTLAKRLAAVDQG